MSNFLTSFLWKGVELNDGNIYGIPLADQGLDDPNSADATWAYRKGTVPVQTALSIKEGVFTLNINIIARYGETPAQYDAKIQQLRAIFDTRDPAFYQLQRKLPHESTYRFLNVAPREMAVNRLERKVAITLQTADKSWQDATLHTQQITLFDTPARTEDMVISYAGNFAAEPTITVKALTVGSDGPVPLYYRDVTVYAAGAGQGGWPVGNPVLIATGWNTDTLVSGGKMRADGLDITVALADGTQLVRYIGGVQNSRKVWVKPHTWPAFPSGVLFDGPGAGAPTDPPQSHRSLLAGDTVAYVTSNGNETWPQSGKIALDNEIIAYTSATVIVNQIGYQQLKLAGLTRGADGTVAADHLRYTRLKRPTTLRISYGYAAGYQQAIYNDLNGWPLIDYETSTNGEWVQTDTYDPNPNNRPWVWRPDTDPNPLRTWENIIAYPEDQQHLALYGTYQTGSPNSTVHHRLKLPAPGVAARELTHIRLKMTLKGGQAGYPSITVRLMRQSETGATRELWNYTHNSASELQVDTGYIDALTGMMSPISFYYIRIDNAAPGAQVRNLRLDEFRAKLDNGGAGADYPIYTALGSEGGLGLGEYPVSLTIQNVSDGGNPQAFQINTRMSTNQQVTVDAGERNVTGMTLSECSYQNPTWLRLVAGSNTLRFTGPTGAGQMLVTVSWRERF